MGLRGSGGPGTPVSAYIWPCQDSFMLILMIGTFNGAFAINASIVFKC